MRKIFKFLKYSLFALLFLIIILAIYLSLQTPTNSGDWQTQFRVLPSVTLNNDSIDITNLRDFRYNPDESINEIRYVNRSYQLSQFKNAWYGISHFGENGLAHVLLSFEFENNEYLAVSIEARLQNEDIDGYNPVHGLFRQYNKIIVLATEQDVIGLRTHVRGEPLYLYKLEVPELYTKPLLLNFLRQAQVLNRKPAFYNSILDNCMTGLLKQSDQFKKIRSWMDKRILLPGNSDELAYELEYINTDKPFNQTRINALINPNLTGLDDPEFSIKIRNSNAIN